MGDTDHRTYRHVLFRNDTNKTLRIIKTINIILLFGNWSGLRFAVHPGYRVLTEFFTNYITMILCITISAAYTLPHESRPVDLIAYTVYSVKCREPLFIIEAL